MDYGSMMNGVKKTIGEVAQEISGSQLVKDALPGMEKLTQETSERLAKDAPVSAGLEKARNYLVGLVAPNVDYDPTESIKRILRKEGDIDDAVAKQLTVLKNKGIDSASLNDKTASAVKRQAHQHYQEGMRLAKANPVSGEALYEELSTVDKAGALIQTYFSHPDEAVRQNRIVGAAGAYMGAAIGARVMTGGTLTTDSYGRRNLVGVPFI